MFDTKEIRLQGLPLFKNADKKAISHLASAADEATVPAGQTLIVQGHMSNEMYVIESGTASVLIDGNEVAEIPEGEMFGELGFFVTGPSTATVQAKTEMTVLVIPHNRFDVILNENPDLVREIANELAERLHATDAKLH
jgi:CRP-like cAMP-binding protein